MNKIFKSLLITLLLFFFFSVNSAQAGASTLANSADTITSSRPSAASPLNADSASGVGSATIFDNSSIFLSSDSAKFVTVIASQGVWSDTINVASQSADRTKVFFTANTTAAHYKWDVMASPTTAKHTVTFTNKTAIPASGQIQILFPIGNTTNQASPSATGFSFNGLTNAANLTIGGGTCTSWTVTAASGLVACTLTSAVNANTAITITIGSSTPVLINPTKTAALGTADTWMLTIKTLDGSNNVLDSDRTKIGTLENVLVQATVDPYLSVVVAGMANGANFNTVTGCASETTNSGIASSATSVDLGSLGAANLSLSGQTITVTTNASFGYSITATSSGALLDTSSGYWIKGANTNGAGGSDIALTANDTPVPAIFPASATERFGISPCGTRSNAIWTPASAVAFNGGAKLSNPYNSGTNSYYASIASYTGPIASDVTAIRYAATVTTTTPAGSYRTFFGYVVTPTF